jgi:hypothetical protein
MKVTPPDRVVCRFFEREFSPDAAIMKSTIQSCSLVVCQLKEGKGVTESSLNVSSLEQLFDRCLSLADEHLPERFVIEGSDDSGHRRVLTFTFQSSSDSE